MVVVYHGIIKFPSASMEHYLPETFKSKFLRQLEFKYTFKYDLHIKSNILPSMNIRSYFSIITPTFPLIKHVCSHTLISILS